MTHNSKKNTIFYFALSAICIAFAACESSSSSSTSSVVDPTDARISSFRFSAVDSLPGLGEATFAVEHLADSGVGRIRLTYPDSIRFGTPMQRIVPIIKFHATPAEVEYILPDTTIPYTGYDTLDFSHQPIYIRVISNDRSNTKKYLLDAPVHQADPDLYIWSTLTQAIAQPHSAEQKTLFLDETFYFFTNDGFQTTLHTSGNGIDWTPVSPNGLPADCHVRNIIALPEAEMMYYAQGNALYSSADGATWTENDLPHVTDSIICLMSNYQQLLWGIATRGEHIVLLALDVNKDYEIVCSYLADDNFPISDFATTTFPIASGIDHCIIAGGYNRQGEMMGNIWLMEKTEKECRLVKASAVDPFAGASIIWYAQHLMWIGGVNSKNQYLEGVRISENEGCRWSEPTTEHNIVPALRKSRSRQSILVIGDYIYAIGGQSADTFHTDVCKGFLNSVVW